MASNNEITTNKRKREAITEEIVCLSGNKKQKCNPITDAFQASAWTKSEDERLYSIVIKNPTKNWDAIAELHATRTSEECKSRWENVINKPLVKGPWTKEEDELLRLLVAKNGPRQWTKIATKMNGRVGKQCNERWHNHLCPDLKKGPFTKEEDVILLQKQAELGNKWAQIAKFLPGRAQNTIKNRWNATLKRKKQQKSQNNSGSFSKPVQATKEEKDTVKEETENQPQYVNANLDSNDIFCCSQENECSGDYLLNETFEQFQQQQQQKRQKADLLGVSSDEDSLMQYLQEMPPTQIHGIPNTLPNYVVCTTPEDSLVHRMEDPLLPSACDEDDFFGKPFGKQDWAFADLHLPEATSLYNYSAENQRHFTNRIYAEIPFVQPSVPTKQKQSTKCVGSVNTTTTTLHSKRQAVSDISSSWDDLSTCFNWPNATATTTNRELLC